MRKPKSELLGALASSESSINLPFANETAISRRSFLSNSLKAAASLGISALVPRYIFASYRQPTIAILGGGIAGLNAAWHLKKAGFKATIYEGDTVTGGRIKTVKNFFGEGLTTEIGAEFIDSTHTDILKLVHEFGLQLKDRTKDPLNTGEGKEVYVVEGRRYSLKEVITSFNHYTKRIEKDAASLGYINNTPSAHRLDFLSIEQYFDKIELTGWLRKLLTIAYTSEFGMHISEQSSLNFLTMISPNTSKGFDIYGSSDERYGVVGGNAMITKKLAEKLEDQIKANHVVNAIRSSGTGYNVSFENGSQVKADFVIVAIPFTMLRNVELRIDNMPGEKLLAIKELGYGNNSKLILGMNSRPWRENSNAVGYAFNEKIGNGWDSSAIQNGNTGTGSYTMFVGADDAIRVANMKGQQQVLTQEYLPALEGVFPGCKGAFINKQLVADWPNQPFIKASYAAYEVGQWTSIAGNEIKPVGNLFFAGEHCSIRFQGFMNGGAETGRLAAYGVLRKVKSARAAM